LIVGSASTAQAGEPPPPMDAPPPKDPPPVVEEAPAPEVVPEVVEPGTITGHVLDPDTQLGLPGVSIHVTGPNSDQTIGSDVDGGFTIVLPPGTYTVEFATPDHVTQTRTVVLASKASVPLELVLATEIKTGKAETIEVVGTIDTRKASAVLAERRAAATVSDAVSSEQIARSPDSNASDAAKRIVSATIQDNRYVVIRGLGGRYSTTLLNGVPLPSPDPDIPAAPLDLFPASLITNLTVHKTFAPDLPGNFAGGALGIETRTYPTKFTFKAKVGMGTNSESSFRTLASQQGGTFDVLGFDDGTRALPSVIPAGQLAGDYKLPAEKRNQQIAAFKNDWGVERGTVGPNASLGVTVGDTLRIADQRVGYFASASYSHGFSHRVTHIARPGGDDGMGGTLPSQLQLDDDQSVEQANLGAVASAGWTPRAGHKLDVFTLYSHTADITASEITGTEASTAVVDRTRLQFLQRELVFTQLVGENRLADKALLEWQGNVARVAQHEPDTRDLLRTETTDGRFAISSGVGGAERLYGELSDLTLGGASAVRIPLDAVKLKAGAAIQRSARDYQARRFHFDVSGDAVYLSPDEAFSPEKAGATMMMYEATLPSDGYIATRTVAAAFAMADVNPTEKLRLIGGARFEASDLDVGLESKIDLMTPPAEHTTHADRDVLPSLNAVYAVTPSTNLRAAYAMTVARPNFREIAPALYYDYVRRRAIGGNPELEETKIHNGDLRWEAFLGDSEVLAASVFAKHFVSPIERTVESGGDGDNIGFANANRANSYGIELEARVSLGRVLSQLAEFSVGGNLSLIDSRIYVGGGAHRALQGQSPYVANLGLGYESQATKTRVDLLYNTFGRRIEEVGTGGAGNVFEEPFHRVDLAVSQPLPRNLRLKLAGSNLLDRRVVRTQDDVEIVAYPVGVTVVGSVELNIE
jgi:outer membrane receptor protein involved in Fe transport